MPESSYQEPKDVPDRRVERPARFRRVARTFEEHPLSVAAIAGIAVALGASAAHKFFSDRDFEVVSYPSMSEVHGIDFDLELSRLQARLGVAETVERLRYFDGSQGSTAQLTASLLRSDLDVFSVPSKSGNANSNERTTVFVLFPDTEALQLSTDHLAQLSEVFGRFRQYSRNLEEQNFLTVGSTAALLADLSEEVATTLRSHEFGSSPLGDGEKINELCEERSRKPLFGTLESLVRIGIIEPTPDLRGFVLPTADGPVEVEYGQRGSNELLRFGVDQYREVNEAFVADFERRLVPVILQVRQQYDEFHPDRFDPSKVLIDEPQLRTLGDTLRGTLARELSEMQDDE